MQSEPSSGIKLTAYSCICWLFHEYIMMHGTINIKCVEYFVGGLVQTLATPRLKQLIILKQISQKFYIRMVTGCLCLRVETSDGYCEECNRLFHQKHYMNFFERYSYTRRYFSHGIKVRNKSQRILFILSIYLIYNHMIKYTKRQGFDKPIGTHSQKKDSVTWLRQTSQRTSSYFIQLENSLKNNYGIGTTLQDFQFFYPLLTRFTR